MTKVGIYLLFLTISISSRLQLWSHVVVIKSLMYDIGFAWRMNNDKVLQL